MKTFQGLGSCHPGSDHAKRAVETTCPIKGSIPDADETCQVLPGQGNRSKRHPAGWIGIRDRWINPFAFQFGFIQFGLGLREHWPGKVHSRRGATRHSPSLQHPTCPTSQIDQCVMLWIGKLEDQTNIGRCKRRLGKIGVIGTRVGGTVEILPKRAIHSRGQFPVGRNHRGYGWCSGERLCASILRRRVDSVCLRGIWKRILHPISSFSFWRRLFSSGCLPLCLC